VSGERRAESADLESRKQQKKENIKYFNYFERILEKDSNIPGYIRDSPKNS